MRSARASSKVASLLCALSLSLGISFPALAEPLYYVLEKGDTLYSVARKYKVSYDALVSANAIADPSKLRTGQKILIPAVHVVAKGETLYGIARAYGTSVAEIRAANKLGQGSLLKPGQVLVLPAGASKPAPATATSAAASATAAAQAATGKGGSAASGSVADKGGHQAASGEAGGGPSLPLPDPLKTSDREVDGALSWPCTGEARYLDGKLFGVMIRAPEGEDIRSVASGRVVSAGPYRGFGQVVFVQAKSGHIYVYGGNESLRVKVGDTVHAGDDLGKVGLDPKEGRAIAYFFVFRGGEALDPAKAPRG